MRYVTTCNKINSMSMMNGREIFVSICYTDMLGITLAFKDYSKDGFDSLHEVNPSWKEEQRVYNNFVMNVKELLKFLHMAFIRDSAEITLYPDKSLKLKINNFNDSDDYVYTFPSKYIIDMYLPNSSEESHVLSKLEIQEMIQLLNHLNLIDMIQ